MLRSRLRKQTTKSISCLYRALYSIRLWTKSARYTLDGYLNSKMSSASYFDIFNNFFLTLTHRISFLLILFFLFLFYSTPILRVCRLLPRLKWNLPSSGLLRSVKRFKTDVLGLPISPIRVKDVSVLSVGHIFKGQAWPFKMGPIGCPETLVLNQLTPRYNLEDGRIQPLRPSVLFLRSFSVLFFSFLLAKCGLG